MRARFLLVLATFTLFPAAAHAASPEGWLLRGNDPSSYLMDRDSVETHDGKPSGRLMSVCGAAGSDSAMTCRGFGTMMQCVDAAAYVGKRIRFSAYVKARAVEERAGLWMRVDGWGDPSRTLAFDNMKSRPIQGSRDWARYDVVLDVAKEARQICFGILLRGRGTVWMSGVRIEDVGTSVPTTDGHPEGGK